MTVQPNRLRAPHPVALHAQRNHVLQGMWRRLLSLNLPQKNPLLPQ
jgi:hypothetical protein